MNGNMIHQMKLLGGHLNPSMREATSARGIKDKEGGQYREFNFAGMFA
jgi:hypothetical protein